MRKYTDYSNTSDFSIPNTPYEPRRKNCHECFGRDKWHDLALEITKLFVQVLENFKTTCKLSNSSIDP